MIDKHAGDASTFFLFSGSHLFSLDHLSYLSLSSSGKCVPIVRGGGIYQENMDEVLDILAQGGWVLTYDHHDHLSLWLILLHRCICFQRGRSPKEGGL